MRRRRDELLQRLRDSNPTPSSTVTEWDRSPEGRAAKERARTAIASDQIAEGSATRRRRRGPFLLAAALVALLSVAGSYAVFYRHPTVSTTAACYQQLGLGSRVVFVVLPAGSAPIEACSREWLGYFGVRAPTRLTECVLNGGMVGVFPYPASMDERGACSSIGAAFPTDG